MRMSNQCTSHPIDLKYCKYSSAVLFIYNIGLQILLVHQCHTVEK